MPPGYSGCLRHPFLGYSSRHQYPLNCMFRYSLNPFYEMFFTFVGFYPGKAKEWIGNLAAIIAQPLRHASCNHLTISHKVTLWKQGMYCFTAKGISLELQ